MSRYALVLFVILPVGLVTAADLAGQASLDRAILAQKNDHRTNVAWCVSQVLLPREIVIPYQIDPATVLSFETESGSRVIVTTAGELRRQAEAVHHGQQKGFRFEK